MTLATLANFAAIIEPSVAELILTGSRRDLTFEAFDYQHETYTNDAAARIKAQALFACFKCAAILKDDVCLSPEEVKGLIYDLNAYYNAAA